MRTSIKIIHCIFHSMHMVSLLIFNLLFPQTLQGRLHPIFKFTAKKGVLHDFVLGQESKNCTYSDLNSPNYFTNDSYQQYCMF